MELADKVVVVTGGANGIGRALCRRFAAEGARAVVVADLDGEGAAAVAEEIEGTRDPAADSRPSGAGVAAAMAVPADVAVEADVSRLVETTIQSFGPIDLFCANAGIATGGGVEASNADWQRTWEVNVLSHVYAARALLPGWLARGEGYLLQTASAAGLLTNLGAAPYAVTKHAVVALAEWLAITHGDAGVRVSCLCPQGVRTNMLLSGLEELGGSAVTAAGRLVEPEDVADAVVEGLRDERFLILTHPEVTDYVLRRATDRDRWLRGMRKLLARLTGG
ncbi:MAG: SDR family oxidoreductase [Acidimicrobiales bacterium]